MPVLNQVRLKLRARTLSRLRKLGFDYECYRVLRLDLASRPTMSGEELPDGYSFHRLLMEDIIQSADEAIRSCDWYGGEDSLGFGIYGPDGRLVSVQWYWFGERYRQVRFWPLGTSDAASMHLITVENQRGHGFATHLKRLSALEMRVLGFSALYSRIWWTNAASLRVSQKAGWSRIGTTLRLRLPFFRGAFRVKCEN